MATMASVIMLYWVLSMFIFDAMAAIEGDQWGLFISFYYAAITFTTIGFGDYSLRWYGPVKDFEVFFLIVFTLFGLVCFIELANLIADEVYSRTNTRDNVVKEGSTAQVYSGTSYLESVKDPEVVGDAAVVQSPARQVSFLKRAATAATLAVQVPLGGGGSGGAAGGWV